MGNQNNLPSSVKVNLFIKDFINKHPENVVIWKDGGKMTIQLSNIGIRDKNMKYASYIANNTLEDENFTLFGLPMKCVYASDNVLRFEGETTDIVEAVTKPVDVRKIPSYMIVDENDDEDDNITVPPKMPPKVDPNHPITELLSNLPVVKPLINRIVTNKVVIKEIKRIDEEKKNNGITVYIIGNPTPKTNEGDNACYVTWEVVDIIHIEAGTTWNDSDFVNKLNEIKAKAGIPSDRGSYGSFNVNLKPDTMAREFDKKEVMTDPEFEMITEGNKISYKLAPEFKLDSSVKVGDIIDTRDYHSHDIWPNNDYQTSAFDYQQLSDVHDQVPLFEFKMPPEVDEVMLIGDSMIPDGAVITI